MSTLLVLGYPTEDKAKQAYQEVLNLDNDLIVNLQSVAVVAKRDNGKFDVVTPGQPIRSGELIGYNAEVQDGEVRLFEFELWNNGKPVDPEGYIVF